jgi:cytochrome c oxidase assembly protein subunit 15
MALKIEDRQAPVFYWLATGVFMIIIQVLLGGITRLTGSGLSITEWKPILGVLPPTTEAEWQASFDMYKQIGQYKQLNTYFTLSDFKFIFFWEWAHRFWARIIGIVFAVPFAVFLLQKRFNKKQVAPLIILFLLGGLQGAIGWIMVKSGINETSLYVDHIKLCLHFIAAMLLLAYTWWFMLNYLKPNYGFKISISNNQLLVITLIILTIQLCYGAFMAGLHAGPMAARWPLLTSDSFFPSGGDSFGILKWISHGLSVQFIHRLLAYLLCTLIVIWFFRTKQELQNHWAVWLPMLMVLAQTLLGIFTVIYSPFQDKLLILGTLHQFVAMLLWMSLTAVLFMRKLTN